MGTFRMRFCLPCDIYAAFVCGSAKAAKAGWNGKYRSNTSAGSACQMHKGLKINSIRARTMVL